MRYLFGHHDPAVNRVTANRRAREGRDLEKIWWAEKERGERPRATLKGLGA